MAFLNREDELASAGIPYPLAQYIKSALLGGVTTDAVTMAALGLSGPEAIELSRQLNAKTINIDALMSLGFSGAAALAIAGMSAGAIQPLTFASNKASPAKGTTTASTSHVRHYFFVLWVAPNAAWSEFKGAMKNAFLSGTGAFGGAAATETYQLCARTQSFFIGPAYVADFGGSPVGSAAVGATTGFTFPGLTIAKSSTPTPLYCCLRVLGPDTTSRAYLFNTGSIAALGEGQILGTDAGVNYADGVTPPPGGGKLTTRMAGGVLNANQNIIATGGAGYTSAPSLYAIDPDTVPPRRQVVGNGNLTAGVITSGTVNANQSGWGDNTYLVLAGGGGPGTAAQIRTIDILVARPDRPVVSAVIFGNSRFVGYTAGDGVGDNRGNYGDVERGINNAFGFCNMSASGMSTATARQPAVYQGVIDLMKFVGATPTIAPFLEPTNDIPLGTPVSTAISNLNLLKASFTAEWPALKYQYATIGPRRTGGSTYVDAATQGTAEVGFGSGGAYETWNTKVRAKTDGLDSGLFILDINAQVADATDATLWRYDRAVLVNSVSTVGSETGDGIHENAVRSTPLNVEVFKPFYAALAA